MNLLKNYSICSQNFTPCMYDSSMFFETDMVQLELQHNAFYHKDRLLGHHNDLVRSEPWRLGRRMTIFRSHFSQI